ncbi:hypothetical protein BDD14_1881 [Edaphobacter modestus]|uniref:Uncharacterized protein n=1 Tax=Edaphobacter modestus TaxID=388466 RepID=A0A4Q7YRK2_9BACT|nr:hypothetical protein BDD14_1881 [Edaphobacter modestus]
MQEQSHLTGSSMFGNGVPGLPDASVLREQHNARLGLFGSDAVSVPGRKFDTSDNFARKISKIEDDRTEAARLNEQVCASQRLLYSVIDARVFRHADGCRRGNEIWLKALRRRSRLRNGFSTASLYHFTVQEAVYCSGEAFYFGARVCAMPSAV